jgi:hypothetical protein
MKRILLSVFPLLFACVVSYAQDAENSNVETAPLRKCGTTEYMEQLKAQDPTLDAQLQQMEAYTQQWIKDNPDGNNDKTVITVPVVVHVVYATAAQNISDTRVQEQINILNRDYAGLNTHSMGAFATTLKSNTELQFCLATKTPTGAASNGIDRKSTTVSQFTSNNNVKHASSGGADQWDPNKYINIWVCNLGGGLCGYAEFPTSTLSATYGVVIMYQYFGVTGAVSPYNQGGTTTHEIGHCFNLYHIWGDDGTACSGTDLCNDTPNQAGENYTCPATGATRTDACSATSPGVMYMNFMDYSDDACYANFTPNQKSRIQACFSANGPLKYLKTSTACSGVGITETEAISDVSIYPNPTQGMINVAFQLANTDDVEITVSNLVGDVVSRITKKNVSAVNVSIDLTSQSAGIYYVKIQSGAQTLTKKISLF